ncbi:hypothetical protein C8N46_101276 [Kordia periserrulae]|uniref:Uncharacterized protein n=1 Tax=Kordia periserrulae TaxID=701523 RepID=A0A2T6C5U0_9FLAO|nr:hypothetical protein C8N46_101276 [Kordia periserrulae]
MKKKSVTSLKLKKSSVSTLNINILTVKGGLGDSFHICNSVNNFCDTINVTKCYGNVECGYFNTRIDVC